MATAFCPACDKPFTAPNKIIARDRVREHLRVWTGGGDLSHAKITEVEGWEEQPFDPT